MKPDSICIIGIYFGKLRNDFPLWLLSCKQNPSIDFLLFIDQSIEPYDIPDNVRCIQFSLEKVVQLTSSKLNMDVCINHPYKLCDFKPAFGLIFEDYIREYEYWGECDFDMVFGNLREFFTKYNYKNYDHFLSQGHLSLYRNKREVFQYMKLPGSKVGDYKTVFSSEKNHAFDENSGIASIYINNNLPIFTKNIYADLSPLYKRLRRSQYNKMDVPPANYKHQVFYWENGRTYCSYLKDGNIETYEVLYIHYQKRAFKQISDYESYANAFYILPDRIVPKTSKTTINDILTLNPYHWFDDLSVIVSWKYNWVKNRLTSRLKKIFNG